MGIYMYFVNVATIASYLLRISVLLLNYW